MEEQGTRSLPFLMFASSLANNLCFAGCGVFDAGTVAMFVSKEIEKLEKEQFSR